jgi:UDPglucose 6-dehydrogenase
VRIAVVGTGHVGLTTCVSMAAMGHHVIGNDRDQEKLIRLNRGIPPFYEPGLAELLANTMESGRLSFTESMTDTLADAEVVFICVGTPARASGEANLMAVEGVAVQIARHCRKGTVVVEKSTVPAGTAERVRRTLARERGGDHTHAEVVSNPEFLQEGRALEDALRPERILVGAASETAFQTMRELYEPWTSRGCRLLETDIATAEVAKHACNAFLALKISYANALASICDRIGADVVAVADVMGSDSRIGRDFLNAGLGYGGYCFPKDLVAFERLTTSVGYEFPMLREVARINERAIEVALEKIEDAIWNLEDKRIALLGLSFKPNTDDIRFSPALKLAKRLIAEGAHVVGYDPEASHASKAEVPELEVAADPYEAAADAHCLVLCTEWEEFLSLNLSKLRAYMTYPTVVDARNMFDAEQMRGAGFSYYPIGRRAIA